MPGIIILLLFYKFKINNVQLNVLIMNIFVEALRLFYINGNSFLFLMTCILIYFVLPEVVANPLVFINSL